MAKKAKARTKRKPGAKRRRMTTKRRSRTKRKATTTSAQPLRAPRPGAELEVDRPRADSSPLSDRQPGPKDLRL
jgi:hypothetical protein